MNIILVRHGQTDWNVKDLLQGRSDIELNELGKKQAEQTAKQLEDLKVAAIYVSPLKRTIVTAQQINQIRNLELKVEDRLIERGFGEYEGRSKVQFRKYWEIEANLSDNKVESIKNLMERTYSLLNDLTNIYKGDENIILVTHNGVNLAISTILNGVKNNIFEYNLKPCEYRIFENVKLKKLEEIYGKY